MTPRIKYQPFSMTEINLLQSRFRELGWSFPCKMLRAALYESGRAIDKTTMSKYLCGRRGVDPTTREKIAAALSLPAILIGATPMRFPKRIAEQDLKICLTDIRLASSLCRLKKPLPTLWQVVMGSEMRYFRSKKEKLSAFRHFFSPSSFVVVSWPGGSAHMLTYRRESSHTNLKFSTTRGRAVLFSAGYEFGAVVPSPMEIWADRAATNADQAAEWLCDSREGVLLSLLRTRKLLIPPKRAIFRSHGIITANIDKPSEATFTQYVFRCDLVLASRPSHQDLQQLSVDGSALALEPLDSTPEVVCMRGDRRVLAMDVLAWKSIYTKADLIEFNNASFVRGFRII